MTALVIVIVVLVVLILANIRVVPQEHAYVLERLGKYSRTWEAGLHVKIPVVDTIAKKVSLKEQTLDFPPQPVITKDNVTMRIDSVVFMKVFDPRLFTYGIENAVVGLETLTATTLRSIVGDLTLDDTLTSREIINSKMLSILDEATDAWGVKVTRVEVKNIQPPSEIAEVMTKQMKAEREKRQQILEAEAHQQSVVARAEGDKKAKVLAAEAERDAQIALAEGKAKSIKMVYEAEAQGLEKLADAHVSDTVLKLKGIEALKDVADGRATKIFMPSDITNAVSSLGVISESLGIGDSTPLDRSPAKSTVQKDDPCCDDKNDQRDEKAAQRKINREITETEKNLGSFK